MTTESGEKNICTQCIGDENFSQWIQDNGEIGECEFDSSHGETHHIVIIKEFADHVDEYFRSNYKIGQEYLYFEDDSDRPSYDRYGELYEEIIANDLMCDSDVLEAVIENLPDDYWPPDGEEAFYDQCTNYERIDVAAERDRREWEEHWYENRISYQWDEFCETVKYTRRFFNIRDLLDTLFGAAKEYEKETVNPIYTLEIGQAIFRARLLDDDFDQQKLRANPRKELGAPPRVKAKAGRMNVEFIPAFYAAFSEMTAIAETRPSIGDSIAIGKFILRSPLKVFDFTVFDLARQREGIHVCHHHTRYEFISEMQNEISKPITPHQKNLEYIPTQIVAEYLKEHFGCNAVIYKSALHKEAGDETRNIVIFNNDDDFIGDNTLLELQTHNLRGIEDINYKIKDE